MSPATSAKIALRNLLKNRRRSAYTVLAISFGFAAVNVFGGFTAYIFDTLEEAHIYTQANGHISIFRKGYLEKGNVAPGEYLLSEADVAAIEREARAIPGIALLTRQLNITGMASNGQVSTVFYGSGREPSGFAQMRRRAHGMIRDLKYFEGTELRDDAPADVGAARGLAGQLGLGLNDPAVLISPTLGGQINALDVRIVQTFEAASSVMNDALMIVPLEFAQSLYETTSVDRVNLLLERDADLVPVLDTLRGRLAGAGLDVDVKGWPELAVYYQRVRDMLDTFFLALFVIVLAIVAMSIINTISMSVLERTREIGTLRAMGMTRRLIIRLFALESGFLGLIGCVVGVIVTLLCWALVRSLDLSFVPPDFALPVPLQVYLTPAYMLVTAVFLVFLATLTAVPTARSAARRRIVDSLAYA